MKEEIFTSTLAALAAGATMVLLVLLALPIAKPLALALIIGVSTMPHYHRLLRRIPSRPNLAASLMVTIVTVCVILPFAALVFLVAGNANDWYQQAVRLAQEFGTSGTSFLSRFPFAGKLFALGHRFGVDVSGYAAKFAAQASSFILNSAADVARNLMDLLFTLAVALFVLYFLYRDGERLVEQGIRRFVSNRERGFRFAREIRATTTAVAVGTLFTCLAQGITAGIGYYVADVPAPFLCGALTAVAALLPVIGTGFVWVPLVALVAINGDYMRAGLLALWCIFMVGLADNAIRPLAIGATSDIPVPAIVLGAICGVFTLGLLGLILGPLCFAILATLWKEATAPEKINIDSSL